MMKKAVLIIGCIVASVLIYIISLSTIGFSWKTLSYVPAINLDEAVMVEEQTIVDDTYKIFSDVIKRASVRVNIYPGDRIRGGTHLYADNKHIWIYGYDGKLCIVMTALIYDITQPEDIEKVDTVLEQVRMSVQS